MSRARRNSEGEIDPESAQAAEDIIQRAWRASIMGLIFPVPIFNLYSVFLLLGVDHQTSISHEAKRRLKRAWAINIALILFVCFVIRAMVVR